MRDRERSAWAIGRGLADIVGRLGRLDLALRVYEDAFALRWRLSHLREGEGSGSLPIPPARLRVRSGPRHLDPSFFLESGRRHSDLIRKVLADNGTSIESLDRLLDFGCGCGRVIRHWSNLTRAEIHGCDLNSEAIAWCAENLSFARYEINGLTPPLPYADNAFDLVYAYSVFTHLPQVSQVAWMRECWRILQPGGYFLFSTLGAHFARNGRLSRHEQKEFEDGYPVVLYEELPGSNLCSAYLPQTYVKHVLAKDFDILEFASDEDNGHHDLYLLRKPLDRRP
jgi:SAM-dependent methyltransferase